MPALKGFIIALKDNCSINRINHLEMTSLLISLTVCYLIIIIIANIVIMLATMMLICMYRINTRATFYTIYFWILYIQLFKLFINVTFYEMQYILIFGSGMTALFMAFVIYSYNIFFYIYMSVDAIFFYLLAGLSVLNLIRLQKPFQIINKHIIHLLCSVIVFLAFLFNMIILYNTQAFICTNSGKIGFIYTTQLWKLPILLCLVFFHIIIPWVTSIFTTIYVYKLSRRLGSKSSNLKRLALFINLIFILLAAPTITTLVSWILHRDIFLYQSLAMIMSDIGQYTSVLFILYILFVTDAKFRKLFLRFNPRLTESVESKYYTSNSRYKSTKTSYSTETWTNDEVVTNKVLKPPKSFSKSFISLLSRPSKMEIKSSEVSKERA